MGGVGDTNQNLDAAIGGENYEVVSMYPDFIQEAESENEKRALSSFRWAWEVEKEHEALFREALASIGSGWKMSKSGFARCAGIPTSVLLLTDARCAILPAIDLSGSTEKALG
jgi:rubrerythrin